jgi:hypothetical protein
LFEPGIFNFSICIMPGEFASGLMAEGQGGAAGGVFCLLFFAAEEK